MAKRSKTCVQIKSITPPRVVHISGDGENSLVGHYGVAVAGNQGIAKSIMYGAAIAGDSATATASKVAAALVGVNSHADVGDSALARAGSGGFASGHLISAMMVDDDAWALSVGRGIAIARAGLAETWREGIAVAQTRLSTDGGARGIAIVGKSGIAIAFDDGTVVKAGDGGALAGYWETGKGPQLALQAVSANGTHKPDTFYRFEAGAFVPLGKMEEVEVQQDIACWREPWTSAAKKLASKKASSAKARRKRSA
jgi:hypothetical protein